MAGMIRMTYLLATAFSVLGLWASPVLMGATADPPRPKNGDQIIRLLLKGQLKDEFVKAVDEAGRQIKEKASQREKEILPSGGTLEKELVSKIVEKARPTDPTQPRGKELEQLVAAATDELLAPLDLKGLRDTVKKILTERVLAGAQEESMFKVVNKFTAKTLEDLSGKVRAATQARYQKELDTARMENKRIDGTKRWNEIYREEYVTRARQFMLEKLQENWAPDSEEAKDRFKISQKVKGSVEQRSSEIAEKVADDSEGWFQFLKETVRKVASDWKAKGAPRKRELDKKTQNEVDSIDAAVGPLSEEQKKQLLAEAVRGAGPPTDAEPEPTPGPQAATVPLNNPSAWQPGISTPQPVSPSVTSPPSTEPKHFVFLLELKMKERGSNVAQIAGHAWTVDWDRPDSKKGEEIMKAQECSVARFTEEDIAAAAIAIKELLLSPGQAGRGLRQCVDQAQGEAARGQGGRIPPVYLDFYLMRRGGVFAEVWVKAIRDAFGGAAAGWGDGVTMKYCQDVTGAGSQAADQHAPSP